MLNSNGQIHEVILLDRYVLLPIAQNAAACQNEEDPFGVLVTGHLADTSWLDRQLSKPHNAFHIADIWISNAKYRLVMGGCAAQVDGLLLDLPDRPLQKSRVRRDRNHTGDGYARQPHPTCRGNLARYLPPRRRSHGLHLLLCQLLDGYVHNQSDSVIRSDRNVQSVYRLGNEM